MNFKSIVKASLFVVCVVAGPLPSLLDAQNGCSKFNVYGGLQGNTLRSSPDCAPNLRYVTNCNKVVYNPRTGTSCGAGDDNEFLDSCVDWVYICSCDTPYNA